MGGERSILEWTEEDFRRAGMLKRSALAGAAHPFITPCQEPHKWDLAQEGTKLYIYCVRCEQTHRLEKDRAIVQNPTTRSGF